MRNTRMNMTSYRISESVIRDMTARARNSKTTLVITTYCIQEIPCHKMLFLDHRIPKSLQKFYRKRMRSVQLQKI